MKPRKSKVNPRAYVSFQNESHLLTAVSTNKSILKNIRISIVDQKPSIQK